MAKRRRKSGGLARQAQQFGNLSTAPERAQTKTELRQAKRDRSLQVHSNDSLFAALQEAAGNAATATSAVPGLKPEDLATALGEIARRRTDTASGAALARQTIETKFQQAKDEGRAQLRELAGRAGTTAAEKLSELKQQKADRGIEKAKLAQGEEGLQIERDQLVLDSYVKKQQLTIDMIEASGKAREVTSKIKQSYNSALAKLRASSFTPPGGKASDKVPVTPGYVQGHRAEVVNGVAAGTELKGNRVLAEAVVQRYLGEDPSASVQRYMQRTGIKLFPGSRRVTPYPGSRPRVSTSGG